MRFIKINRVFFIISFVFLFTLLFSTACERRPIDEETGLPLSVGSYRRITVLSDNYLWKLYGDTLTEALGQRIYTPTLEYIYNVDPVPYEKLKMVRYRKVLFFVSSLTSNGNVSDFVWEHLNEQALEEAKEVGGRIFAVKDFFAKGQIIFFLVAKDEDSVLEAFARDKDKMYSMLENFYYQNVFEGMYNYGEQVERERRLYREYGWHFRIPRGYDIVEELPEENFIWFRKRYPDRIIFVHWEEAPKSQFTEDYCMGKRDELAFKHYDEDLIARDVTTIQDTTFKGMPAYIIEGFWENQKWFVGGPLKTYCFYSESDGRIYIFDTSVFAPGEGKYLLQKRLEIIANTFTTQPVPEDRKSKDPKQPSKFKPTG